jgi:hypothetical protein
MLVSKTENDKVSESLWEKQGATLSHSNGYKQFRLTEDEVFGAMKVGKLQYRANSVNGNPCLRLLRNEVESLAREVHGTKGAEEQEVKHKSSVINKEIESRKRKLASLEKQKSGIMKSHE